MRKVLVTGGTGFVGSWLRKTQPEDVFARYLSRKDYEQGHWMHQSWEYIIHAAHIQPDAVLWAARWHGSKLLYVSSGAVYHEDPDAYSFQKISWEARCLAAHRDTVIARLFAFFNAPGHACSEFVKEAKTGSPLRIWGDGNTVRSYMHGKEMGRWLWAILFNGKAGEAYDVGSDDPVTMLELARMVVRVWPAPILILNEPERVKTYLPLNTRKTRRLLDD